MKDPYDDMPSFWREWIRANKVLFGLIDGGKYGLIDKGFALFGWMAIFVVLAIVGAVFG